MGQACVTESAGVLRRRQKLTWEPLTAIDPGWHLGRHKRGRLAE